METYVLIAICLAVVAQGLPVTEKVTSKLDKKQDVSGIFIPMDSWKTLQNLLQEKTNPSSSTTSDSSIVKLPSQPSVKSNEGPGNGQLNYDQTPPITNRPINSAVVQPGPAGGHQDPKGGQPIFIPNGNQLNNNQPIILVQQPYQNKPILYPQQPNQLQYFQPGQTFFLQNGPNGQVLVPIPTNAHGGYNNFPLGPNPGPVYTLVLNNQMPNGNPNGNYYQLIPAQSGFPNSVYTRAAK